MSKSGTGTELNDEDSTENPQGGKQLEPGGPPLTGDERPHQPGTPHHLESRLATLDPEMRELFEKTIADKVNYERLAKTNSERVAKAETKLNELAQKEQEAEKARLEEQGKYKELAEKAEAEVKQLREAETDRKRRDAVGRELIKAGVLDEELVAEGLLVKYKDEIKPDNLADFVARLKTEKPLLFKSEQPGTPAPTEQVTRSTGIPSGTPTGGSQPSPFDALDKKKSIHEVEREYQDATKNAQW